jgi:toxin secretion/phage lysis holin
VIKMLEYLSILINSDGLKILGIVITLDTIFGILRAIKERNINSCIGIDGIIRKVGMLIAVIFLMVIDSIINLDLIGFIPETVKEIMNFKTVGIADLFMVLFIVFEILSIFKNMILCKLPIPKKLQEVLENAMKEFTGEIKQND